MSVRLSECTLLPLPLRFITWAVSFTVQRDVQTYTSQAEQIIASTLLSMAPPVLVAHFVFVLFSPQLLRMPTSTGNLPSTRDKVGPILPCCPAVSQSLAVDALLEGNTLLFVSLKESNRGEVVSINIHYYYSASV